SICKQLLSLMNGSITVESKAGQGSIFTIAFALQTTIQTEEKEHRVADVLTPLTVLLAEDNPINQIVATRLLQHQGCEVSLAVDGEEAVNKASANSYDLILMDCEMPDVDGYEATRQIRQWELEQNKKATPIYALSAHTLIEQVELCYASGMDGHISKPIVPEDLKAILRAVSSREFVPDKHG
ncbi:hypothetical protein LCGC14_2764920, partial [marine sediment metagenome]